MPDLRFGVLGPLEAFADDRRLVLPAGRRRAVLACLLVHVGRPVPADTLVEAAWGEDLPRDPRTALNTVISRLRAALGADAVRAEPGGYLLDVLADRVDANEFEQLSRRAKTAAPAEARRLLGRALDLWRGPAYAEFADSEFATVEAQRLERLRLDVVEQQARAAIDSGNTEDAVASLEAMLAEHPFREHAVEQVVTALYQAGRQTEALDRCRRYRHLLADELGLNPSPGLRDLEARVLGHDLPPPGRHHPGPPTWLDTSNAFIGRDDALADLVDAVEANRLVTVTGPGGVGKTRLAAEALPIVSERLGLPTTVVELAPVPPARTGTAVADALGLRTDSDAVVESVVEYFGAGDHLLVLDNCEHLLAEVGPLVALIARRCPRVRVLATSRHRLGPPSEMVQPLATLAVPGPDAAVDSQQLTAAVRLFADRVRRLRPSFGLATGNVADVADVCRRLDGLPLAIELAASRAATVGVAQVREHLPADLVGEGSGDLQAVVEWSYGLLTDEQRRLMACLSVFPGEFDSKAVRGMTEHLGSWTGDATRAVAELVESSLVVGRHEGSEMSYRLLVIVRAFAVQRLVESGEAEAAHLAHANWVRDLTTRLARDWSRCDGAVLGAGLNRAGADIAAAVGWALETGRIELAGSITRSVALCVHWTPGLELSELITEVAERGSSTPSPGVAGGVAAGAFFAAERGEVARARRLARAALRMSDEPDVALPAWLTLAVAALYAGDHDEAASWFRQVAAIPQFVGEANTSLALLACYADDLPAAREHAQIALAAGPSGADASHAFARYAAGEVEARTDPGRGAELLAEAATEADRVGASQVSQVARVALFALLVRGGRHDDAADLGVRLLHDLRRMGVWPQLWTTLRVSAELLAATARQRDAAILLAAADAAASAPPLVGEDVDRYAALSAELRDQLGESVVDQINDLAVSLSRAQAVERAGAVLEGLAREREVTSHSRSGGG